jgi:hypothetical protein
MRRPLCCLLPLACCLLASCSAGSYDLCLFGYTTQSQFARDIHTIRVPIFKNKTFVRDIEFELTEAVVKQIELRTPWKVVGCEQDADTELGGTVVTVNKRNVLVNPLNEIRQGELQLAAQIVWRDLRTGELLSGPRLPPPGPVPPDGRKIPVTPFVNPDGGVLVVRNSSLVPELGQSTASARTDVIDELAKQIVNMMELPW